MAEQPCLIIAYLDFWRLLIRCSQIPLPDGSIDITLTSIQPNGYTATNRIASELESGSASFEINYPMLDDGRWEGPEKTGGSDAPDYLWSRRWIMGEYQFIARIEQLEVSPISVSCSHDVYDLYEDDLNGGPAATNTCRQFIECSPLRPTYINEDRGAFSIRTIHQRVESCEIEADVVTAKGDDVIGGPWHMSISRRRKRKSFSMKGWPSGDYWIRFRALQDGAPTGAYCVRLFTKQGRATESRIRANNLDTTNIGCGTLFLTDDTFFDHTQGIQFLPDSTQRMPDRPAIESDRPWELDALTIHDISYDEQNRQFRMIYRTGSHIPEQSERKKALRHAHMLAVSQDGITWEKPNLNLTEFEGSKANNILSNRPTPFLSGKHDHESDEARRAIEHATIRYYNADRDGPIDMAEIFVAPGDHRGFPLACRSTETPPPPEGDDLFRCPNSSDRGHTPLIERNGDYLVLSREPLVYGGVGQNLMHGTETVRGHANLDGSKGLFYFYRPTTPGYAPHWAPSDNLCRSRRQIAVLWTTDGLNWQRRYAISPDEFDVDGTVFYSMNVIGPTGSCLVEDPPPSGFKRNLHARSALKKNPMYLGKVLHYELWRGHLWPELVWSRDLVTWHRFTKQRRPFIELGSPGTYSGGWSREAEGQSYQFGDEWWFPYSASPSLHYTSKAFLNQSTFDQFKKRFPHYLKEGNFKSWRDIYDNRRPVQNFAGIARCKAGRVAHAEPINETGHLVTQPLSTNASQLVVNAAVAPGGSLRIEAQNTDGSGIQGWQLDDCEPFTGDTVTHTMAWRGQKELPKGDGPLRLLIEMNRSKLYGMSFS